MSNDMLCQQREVRPDAMDLMQAHQDRIKPMWEAAFSQPPPSTYQPGDVVWLLDHYSTARVINAVPRTNGGLGYHWLVETSFADGSAIQFEYDADWLRPALEEVVFHWPEVK